VVALIVPNLAILREIASGQGLEQSDLKSLCDNSTVTSRVLEQLKSHSKQVGLNKSETPTAIKLISVSSNSLDI